jgi:hypothetical protein
MEFNYPQCHTFLVKEEFQSIDNLIFRFDLENHYYDKNKEIEIILLCVIYQEAKECVYLKVGIRLSLEKFFFDSVNHILNLHEFAKLKIKNQFHLSMIDFEVPPLPDYLFKAHQLSINKLKNRPLFNEK